MLYLCVFYVFVMYITVCNYVLFFLKHSKGLTFQFKLDNTWLRISKILFHSFNFKFVGGQTWKLSCIHVWVYNISSIFTMLNIIGHDSIDHCIANEQLISFIYYLLKPVYPWYDYFDNTIIWTIKLIV